MRGMTVFAIALVLAGCNGATDSEDNGPAPTLPAADPAMVLVEDNFDQENGGKGMLNWAGSARWSVAAGCVDLHGNGFHDVQPGSGLYLDLDGTCQAGGTLESKTPLALEAGSYVLEFGLGGNRRINEPDTVVVSVGTHFREQVVVERAAGFSRFAREFTVAAPTTAAIRFVHSGGDNQGMVLDLVRLRRK